MYLQNKNIQNSCIPKVLKTLTHPAPQENNSEEKKNGQRT